MDRLERISLRQLNRAPGPILERVRIGQRFIVCKNGHPVATLQPLDGYVLHPSGRAYDLYGCPLGDASVEIAKLTEAQHRVLGGTHQYCRMTTIGPFDELREKGLARRGGVYGGHFFTAKGLVLREGILAARGFEVDERFNPMKRAASAARAPT